jgi:hypothetical protein
MIKNLGSEYRLDGIEFLSKSGIIVGLHKRNCFNPVDVSSMTRSVKNRAMQSLLFLTGKRDGRIKGRLVYNGKPTRDWLSKEEAASPTSSLEGILLTSIVDVKENRDVMSADIPNAFIQAHLLLQRMEMRGSS